MDAKLARWSAAALLALTTTLGAQVAPLGFDDFSWTLSGEVGAGPASVTSTTMTVVGPDAGCLGGGVTWYETTAPTSGQLTALVDYSSVDICHYDWPVTVVDGIAVNITGDPTDDGCDILGVGDVIDMPIVAGQTFGFGVASADCFEGPGTAVVYSFQFTPEPIQFWLEEGGELDPRQLTEISSGASLGRYVALPGDVTGDGVPEVAIANVVAGSITLRSGADGGFLWEASLGGGFGQGFAAPGDVDDDGLPDLIVAHRGLDFVYALSGVDGQIEWTWSAPANLHPSWSLTQLADVNGDGSPDAAVAGRNVFTDEEHLSIISGLDGARIADFMPNVADPVAFGESADDAGDVDGDGTTDVIVGVPSTTTPRAMVYSGADGSVLHELAPPSALQFEGFGVAVAGAGDVNGDDVPDLLVSAPSASDDQATPDTGAVLLYNGATGVLGQTIFGGAQGAHLGARLLGGLDTDASGTREMLVTSGVLENGSGTAAGSVSVRRTVGGGTLLRLIGEDADGQFGFGVAAFSGAGGTSHLAIGAPFGDGPTSVSVWHELTHPGAPRLNTSGTPSPGEAWALSIANGPALAPAGLVLGLSEIDAPFKGGVLVPAPDKILFLTLDGSGAWGLGGLWPASAPPTLPIWIQAWVQDPAGPAGWTATEAVRTAQT